MTATPEGETPRIDVRSLSSVRQALRALAADEGENGPGAGGEVILGDDWVSPSAGRATGRRGRTRLRSLVTLQQSPLARKIVTFNLIALILLVAGMLWLTPSRDSLASQRARGLVSEAHVVAALVEARLPSDGVAADLRGGLGGNAAAAFAALGFHDGAEAFLFDARERLVAVTSPIEGGSFGAGEAEPQGLLLTDLLNALGEKVAGLLSSGGPVSPQAAPAVPSGLVAGALEGAALVDSVADAQGRTVFTVAVPVRRGEETVGVVVMRSAAGEIDALVRREREQVLRMFLVAVAVSIGLSMVLASTIANPLSDLAAAAESGRDRNARHMSPSRVRIPDLSARPDEIGRLSAALRGMVAALYERIEANEQFAADVAHEIKNPLASLRSAVGSFPFARKDEQRQKLLDIIEHDVRRLDRLVSDISSASRLDSELVKEEEKAFDLMKMLSGLDDFLGEEARTKGIDFIADLPEQPIVVQGLEGRLAQVFVNLIGNAISFCEEGDAIRLWARKRDNRVLVVVEDTGPGIPEASLAKIFQRFYSERPEGQFGNNSGLGLAISKQIVEAHGGVIWAENIRPTEADPTSAPLGARFVVGLPV